MKKKITYAKSGVNIDEGNLFVKKIQPFVKRTLSKNTIGNTTSFAALYSLYNDGKHQEYIGFGLGPELILGN